MCCNFCKIHKTLRVTPAMEVGHCLYFRALPHFLHAFYNDVVEADVGEVGLQMEQEGDGTKCLCIALCLAPRTMGLPPFEGLQSYASRLVYFSYSVNK
jgi:hypothetical protein